MNFHEVRFPTQISLGASGGPERRTDVVVLGSGFEERNTRWADSRRAYNAGYGVRSLDDLHEVIAFFEERRGQLYGFRWRDPIDWSSSPPETIATTLDQTIGTGDGTTATFQLTKTYGASHAPWLRRINKPVAGSVLIAVDGIDQTQGAEFDIDTTTGIVTFDAGAIPAAGSAITAGFAFDVPVRFATDKLDIDLRGFNHGAIPNIPITEVRI